MVIVLLLLVSLRHSYKAPATMRGLYAMMLSFCFMLIMQVRSFVYSVAKTNQFYGLHWRPIRSPLWAFQRHLFWAVRWPSATANLAPCPTENVACAPLMAGGGLLYRSIETIPLLSVSERKTKRAGETDLECSWRGSQARRCRRSERSTWRQRWRSQ